MLTNYIKIAWRNILKNKGFSALNIIGLAIGLTAVMLSILWIQDQLAYDNFYKNKKDIYKIWTRSEDAGNFYTNDIVASPMSKTLKEEFPEVLEAGRIYWPQEKLISYADKKIKIKGNQVDESMIRIFDFPIVRGNKNGALDNESSLVLTRSIAEAIFGEEDPIGKVVKMEDKNPYTVTAVLEDLPGNTDFDFTFLMKLPEKKTYSPDWSTNTYYSFVLLRPGTDIEMFNKKILGTEAKHAPERKKTEMFLYPVSKMHLYSKFENDVPIGGKIDDVRMVAIIGGVILLIACINFINLSTARSQKRAKEVGVRKVVGAQKSNLIKQFLTESMIVAFIAGTISFGLTILSIPIFNSIADRPLTLGFDHYVFWVGLLGLVLLSGLLAGFYPAVILSSFDPLNTIKGIFKGTNKTSGFRETLVVFQFGTSVVLIVASIVIFMQVRYSSDRDIGYETDGLVEVPVEGDVDKNYEVIRNELVSSNTASGVARSGGTVTQGNSSTGGGFRWEGSTVESEKNFSADLIRTNGGLVGTLNLRLIVGRDIDLERMPADSTSLILNEAAIKAMGLKDPVGKLLEWGKKNTLLPV